MLLILGVPDPAPPRPPAPPPPPPSSSSSSTSSHHHRRPPPPPPPPPTVTYLGLGKEGVGHAEHNSHCLIIYKSVQTPKRASRTRHQKGVTTRRPLTDILVRRALLRQSLNEGAISVPPEVRAGALHHVEGRVKLPYQPFTHGDGGHRHRHLALQCQPCHSKSEERGQRKEDRGGDTC